MLEVQRVHYLTRRYPHLQGLRLIPLGSLFCISAAWRSGLLSWVPGTAGAGARVWFFVLSLAALTTALAAGTYYRTRYGSVHLAHSAAEVLTVCVFLALFVSAALIQDAIASPVSLPALVIGMTVAYLGTRDDEPQVHYLAVAALFLIFATTAAFGLTYHARDVGLDLLMGLSLIAIGLGDHAVLLRTLQAVPRG